MRLPTPETQVSEDWLDQFPDDMSMAEIAVSPTYVVNVAREVIAESAYGVGSTVMASDVQEASALLALLVAAEWFDGKLDVQVVAGDAPTQKMVATAMEMTPTATLGHGRRTVLRMTGAAEDMYADMDALSVRTRFSEAKANLAEGFDFNEFSHNLGGAFIAAVASSVEGVN